MKRKRFVYTMILTSLLALGIFIVIAHSPLGLAAGINYTYLPLIMKEYLPHRLPRTLPVGVQMLGTEGNQTALSRAEEAGVNWARIALRWSDIEPTRGNYNWNTSFNTALARLIAHGITPIVEVRSSPGWAHEDTGEACGPIDPGDLGAFQNFVTALVEHYDGDGVNDAPGSLQVNYWEFWNEPDNQLLTEECELGGCWGGDIDNDGTPDPEEYVTMLQRAYPAVKASNPQAQVVFGGLALEDNPPCFNLDFLDQVLAHGGGAFFDLMNFHQYDFQRDDWDGSLPYNQGILGKANSIKAILTSYGLSKPLICSETSLSSTRPGQDGLQARHLVHEFVRGMSIWPNDLKAILWFRLGDWCDAFGCYGLLGYPPNYTPYLAYYAYDVMTSQLEGANFEHQLDSTETGNPWIQAYRFNTDSGKVLVLWTDSGERIKVQPDQRVDMAIGPTQLNDTWTGKLRIVDLYGNVTTVTDGGAGDRDGAADGSITLEIAQSPIYVSATP